MVASTNLTSLAYDAETVLGTTNATPDFTLLPTTGGSPVNNISTAVSEVIRSDRQTDDLVVVDGEIGGDINFELSYAPYKDFMASLLLNTTTVRTIGATGVSFDGTVDSTKLNSTLLNLVIQPGDVFKVTSASEPTIDGVYTCTNNTTSNEITFFPDPGITVIMTDVSIDALTITTNGADAIQGYTIKKTATDGTTPYYWYYRGCAINSMNLNFSSGSILNGSFGIVGLTEETATALIAGETEVATPAYSIMNAVTSVGTIRIGGVTLGTCSFASLDLTIDNQINQAKSIGVLGACDLAPFSLMVTGNAEVYFNNLDLYNQFVAATSFSLTIIVTDTDGNSIGIDMPKCKFETLETPISGKDAFLMQSGSFKALRDSTLDYMVKISRIDA